MKWHKVMQSILKMVSCLCNLIAFSKIKYEVTFQASCVYCNLVFISYSLLAAASSQILMSAKARKP